MRVHTIELANLRVGSDVIADFDGGFLWVVRVTERSLGHRLVFEKSGNCGRVSKGDAQDIAAARASDIAAGLASLAPGEFTRARMPPAAR
ncbi:MAG: hypothetical protein QOC89_359 [Paraburkholderia sp.]|jgi:hypothetical protein|uniref:hypothetical protein n=1 Tax=Paraburkholderia sp. TaxID=1926495 RepID=UPI002AFEACC4|nr:hypothetical protein [Paraburkholderia sp.]MEA3082662.1 hypothetical protein [Paraburkholderia sp.]